MPKTAQVEMKSGRVQATLALDLNLLPLPRKGSAVLFKSGDAVLCFASPTHPEPRIRDHPAHPGARHLTHVVVVGVVVVAPRERLAFGIVRRPRGAVSCEAACERCRVK